MKKGLGAKPASFRLAFFFKRCVLGQASQTGHLDDSEEEESTLCLLEDVGAQSAWSWGLERCSSEA